MYRHADDVKRGYTPNKSNKKSENKIKKILNCGYSIKYKKVFITINEKLAYDKEKELILEIGLDNLCNMTAGGDGGSVIGRTVSENTRKKMSISQRKRERQSYGFKGKLIRTK